MKMSEMLSPQAIQAALTTTLLGRRIEVHQQVGSTNDLAREAARQGEKEGLVILAEEQTAGRGRMGRAWTAPPGCCLLCSILLRPRFSPHHAFHLTMAASLAIYRAIARTMDAQTLTPDPRPQTPDPLLLSTHSLLTPHSSLLTIKWPNDVLLGGRKVSGALCESEWSGDDWLFTVIGFGINVNLDLRDLGDLQATATSLSAELRRDVDRVTLLIRVLEELESLYLLLQNGQLRIVRDAWAEKLETVGRGVTVQEPDGIVEGRALRVDPDGALILATRGGERRVIAGEVMPL